ncbi:hypothetical protein AADC20_002384, partial [Salmonella enterica]
MNNVGGSPFYRPDNGAKAPCLTGRQEVHHWPGARCVTGLQPLRFILSPPLGEQHACRN